MMSSEIPALSELNVSSVKVKVHRPHIIQVCRQLEPIKTYFSTTEHRRFLNITRGTIRKILHIMIFRITLLGLCSEISCFHHCWVGRGNMEWEVYPTLQHMTNSANWTRDLLILSPIPYPLSHMLPSKWIVSQLYSPYKFPTIMFLIHQPYQMTLWSLPQ